ncbi:unnamed protein product [Symbiodinium sp. CCMP2592]|nr:unnamed protein product [Symbiodinium sp. CCMP2592]
MAELGLPVAQIQCGCHTDAQVIPPDDSEGGSDLLAAAQSAADAAGGKGLETCIMRVMEPKHQTDFHVSSGAASSAVSVTRGHLGDLFVPNKASGQVKEPVAPPKPSEGSESGSDFFGLAKGVAAEVSKSGVESVSAGRGGVGDLFAPMRVTTPPAEDSEAGSDLLAAARTAADAVSSGVASSAVSAANGRLRDLFAPSQASRGKAPAVPPKPSEGSDSGSDLLGFAKGAAAEVSRSGVQSATSGLGGGGMRHLFVPPARSRAVTTPPAEDSEAGSDLLAAARTAADAVSSGVASSAVSAANGRLRDLFAPSQASRGKAPAVPPKPSEGSDSGSDLLGFAKGAAAEVSRSGVQSATSGLGGGGMRHLFVPPARSRAVTTPPAEDSEAGSDLLAAARTAADAVSSGVASSAVSAANGRLRDLFASNKANSVRRGRDVEAAPPRRRTEVAGQHQSAPPKSQQPPWAQALDDGAETENVRARTVLPVPVPSPPRLRAQPPQPPDPPPLPNRTFLTDPNEEGDAGAESGELVMARGSECRQQSQCRPPDISSSGCWTCRFRVGPNSGKPRVGVMVFYGYS